MERSTLVVWCFLATLAGECMGYIFITNPLESRDNYSAASNNMKLVHQPAQASLRCTSPSINGGHCTSHRIAV